MREKGTPPVPIKVGTVIISSLSLYENIKSELGMEFIV